MIMIDTPRYIYLLPSGIKPKAVAHTRKMKLISYHRQKEGGIYLTTSQLLFARGGACRAVRERVVVCVSNVCVPFVTQPAQEDLIRSLYFLSRTRKGVRTANKTVQDNDKHCSNSSLIFTYNGRRIRMWIGRNCKLLLMFINSIMKF